MPTDFSTHRALQGAGPCSYLLKLANGSRAGGGVLAHTHRGVALVQLTHLAMFAVVILAGVWRTEHSVSSPDGTAPYTTDGNLGLTTFGHTRLPTPEIWTSPNSLCSVMEFRKAIDSVWGLEIQFEVRTRPFPEG